VDDDPQTADVCLNAGSCTASCSNEACDIACSTDADCDDSDIKTNDACESPNICEANCTHEGQKDFSFEIVSDLNAVGRGQALDLNLLVRDLEGNPVEDAELSLIGPTGQSIDFNSVGNGYYIGTYVVPEDSEIGEQTISFLASSGSLVGVEDFKLEVISGNITAVLVQPVEPIAVLGEKLEIKFKLVYDNNSLVGDGNATAVLNNVSISLLKDANGLFVGHYLFSESDLESAVLIVNASDSLGNEGTTSIIFDVRQALPLELIAIAFALAVALVVSVYGIKKTHRLSTLLSRLGGLQVSMKKTGLQRSVAKEKKQIASLGKKIARQEKDMKLVKKEIELERKKQAISISQIPSESTHTVHKTALSAFLFPGKISRMLRGIRKSEEELKVEKRLQAIDAEVDELREKIRNLESEFCRQTIKEDFFRKKLFEYREKVHLLELEKKKIA
jgi:hypothetical protein